MWLKSLHVENFRGFEKLDITFDEHVTLLVGGNGAGKSGVLEAIKVAMGSYFAAIDQSPDQSIDMAHARRVVHELGGSPILEPQWPVKVAAVAHISGYPLEQGLLDSSLHWERTRAGREQRTAWGGEAAVRTFGSDLQRLVQTGEPVPLPLLACYGTGRLWRQRKITEERLGIGTRFDGYTDCLDIASSEQLLTLWLYDKRLIELEARESDPSASEPRLAAVTRAVCDCVEGVTRFWVDLKHKEIRIDRGGTVESLSMLSDGYRNMIAMVADIAQRAATLNPQFGADAARETAGIVLIDEIELHLHPKWQRSVIPSLRRAFPKMQFIATTHSPQVVSTVARNQLRVLHDNRVIAEDAFVEGRSSDELLVDIFGVPMRPTEMVSALDELFYLLDTERWGEARAKLRAIEEQLGPHDSSIVRAHWILDTEGGVKHVPAAS